MKKSLFAAVCLAAVIAITACQPTPEAPAVVGKGEGQLEETLRQKEEPTVVKFPNELKMEVEPNRSGNKIAIDAEIIVPSVSAFPVQRVTPDGFSQEDTDNIVNYFFGEAKLFSPLSKKPKAEVEEELIKAKADLAMAKDATEDDLAGLKSYIKNLEEELAGAPENVEKEYITTELKPTDNGISMLYANADLGYHHYSNVSISNDKDNYQAMCTVFIDDTRIYLDNINLRGKNPENQSMTLQEAQALAQKTIDELGYEGYTVSSVNAGSTEDQSKQGYTVSIKRDIGGVLQTDGFLVELPTNQNIDYAARWKNDLIKMSVDDNGVSEFSWLYKSKILDTANENVKLLPFEEMKSIFEQQLKNRFSFYDDMWSGNNPTGTQTDANYEILIDKIKLEYQCIPEKDKPGQYLLVPAWCLYGNLDIVYNEFNQRDNQFSSDMGYILLCLNAIDGSVIAY